MPNHFDHISGFPQENQPSTSSAEAPRAKTDGLLRSVWAKNLPLLKSRMLLLEQTAEALRRQTMTEDLWTDAIRTAHNLAGSLGMFGYPEGTVLARLLEQALTAKDHRTPDARVIASLTERLRAALPL